MIFLLELGRGVGVANEGVGGEGHELDKRAANHSLEHVARLQQGRLRNQY